MDDFNWTCPHYGHPQIAGDGNVDRFIRYFGLTELAIGDVATDMFAVSCLNNDCRKLTLRVSLREWPNRRKEGTSRVGDVIHFWQLMPEFPLRTAGIYTRAPSRGLCGSLSS